MVARETIYSSPGGDTTQIKMTAKELVELGVDVDIMLATDKINYLKYDIIHFFNIIRPDDILPHIRSGLPYVVSTIYVDYSEYDKLIRKGFVARILKIFNPNQIEFIKTVGRFIFKGNLVKSSYYFFNGHYKSVLKVAADAHMLLPNSDSEYKRFVNDYGIVRPYRKIVNAIDPKIFSNNVEPNKTYLNHVVCAGRVEGIKNQLNLIKALVNTKLNLTIVGKPSPNQLSYYDECVRVAATGDNVKFIDHIDHSELVRIYSAAKVHVLPSWFETTGLSSLESAAMNCNIVITKKGDTEEYFGSFAYYCEPHDLDSIRNSVFEAYESDINPKFREHIMANYTWKRAAEQTLQAYNELLKGLV